jgi:phage shock protein E
MKQQNILIGEGPAGGPKSFLLRRWQKPEGPIMKITIIALVVIVLLIIVLNISKSKSMEKIFSLDPSQILVIDVRTREEYDAGHFSTAINIPVDQLASRIAELAPHKQKGIILYCHSGARAAAAEKTLKSNGFTNVINAGGYDAIRKFDTN